jgi:hypothetical protein
MPIALGPPFVRWNDVVGDLPIAPPVSWLLRIGWLRAGRLSILHAPASPKERPGRGDGISDGVARSLVFAALAVFRRGSLETNVAESGFPGQGEVTAFRRGSLEASFSERPSRGFGRFMAVRSLQKAVRGRPWKAR